MQKLRAPLLVLGAAAVVAGQWILFSGRLAPGVYVTLAGALAFALVVFPVGDMLARLGRALKAARASAPRARTRPGGPAAAPPRAGRSLSPAVKDTAAPWTRVLSPFRAESLSFSSLWLLLPAGLLAALSQPYIQKGSNTVALPLLFGAVLLVAVCFQESGKPIVVPNLNHNFRMLGLLLLALPFQAYGVVVLWRYAHVMRGFLVVVAASAYMILVLSKWKPFAGSDGRPIDAPFRHSVPAPFFGPRVWAVKGGILLACLACLYLSRSIFLSANSLLVVLLGFASIALLLASFPWLPWGALEAPAVPARLRAPLALAALTGAFLLGLTGQNSIEAGRLSQGLLWILAGGIVLILGVSPFREGDSFWGGRVDESGAWTRKAEIFWVLALFLVAFGFRFWHVGTFPLGTEGDEAAGGIWGWYAMTGQVENPFVSANVPLPFFSVTGAIFKFFGLSVTTMRMHVVIFGTLSVLTTYFLLRLWFGRWPAFLATLLMSFSYWHLHFSRFGHYNIEQVCMQMVAFYFVFRGLKTGRFWPYVLGGVGFGLAMQAHLASRLLPFEAIAFLVFLFASRRDILARHLPGLLAFMLASWAVAAPPLCYWFRVTSISMGRVASVSIFDRANTNAPSDAIDGFVANCKNSMLMFNDTSDTRPRDNPLAPDKILEHWTAILFALAFLYVLYHWRNPVHFFILACFFGNLSASIFSVESPQTLRTAGNISIVFCFIAAMLWDVRRAFLGLGRRAGAVLFALILVPAFVFFSYRSAYALFVGRKDLAYDLSPTLIGIEAGKKSGQNYDAVFWGTGYASSHPPLILFRKSTPMRNYYNLAESLPLTDPDHHNYLLFLGDDYQDALGYVRDLYPAAAVKGLKDPRNGSDLIQEINVTTKDQEAIEGLDAQVEDGDGARRTVDNCAPQYPSSLIPRARFIRWTGSVYIPGYGSYSFGSTGRADLKVLVDGRVVTSLKAGHGSQRALPLAKGLHRIEVDYRPSPQDPPFALTWSGSPIHPVYLFDLTTFLGGPIPKTSLFTIAQPEGFYAQYFRGPDWTGETMASMVEPVVLSHWLDNPFNPPWSCVWHARLRVDEDGIYHFLSSGGDFTQVLVDGKVAFQSGAYPAPKQPSQRPEPNLYLKKGWHDLKLKYSTHGNPWMELEWAPPNKSPRLLMGDRLVPAMP